jgi:hypothetical protein
MTIAKPDGTQTQAERQPDDDSSSSGLYRQTSQGICHLVRTPVGNEGICRALVPESGGDYRRPQRGPRSNATAERLAGSVGLRWRHKAA